MSHTLLMMMPQSQRQGLYLVALVFALVVVAGYLLVWWGLRWSKPKPVIPKTEEEWVERCEGNR